MKRQVVDIIPPEERKLLSQSSILDFSFFNIENVRGYYKIEEDGYIIRLVNAEDIAKGAGLITENSYSKKFLTTSGLKESHYIHYMIRWDRFNEYAKSSIPYLQQTCLDFRSLYYIKFPINKDSYIPIELAVMIIMRCNSDRARIFQAIMAGKITNEINQLIDDKYKNIIFSLENQIDQLRYSIENLQEYVDCRDEHRIEELQNLIEEYRHLLTIYNIPKEYYNHIERMYTYA